MKLSRWAIALYVGLVFASGAVVGALGHSLYSAASVNAKGGGRNPEEFRKRMVADMRTRLKLNDGQVVQLEQILDEAQRQVREAHEKADPEMRAIYKAQVEHIRAMLSPEQQTEYDKMRKEREDRRKARPRP